MARMLLFLYTVLAASSLAVAKPLALMPNDKFPIYECVPKSFDGNYGYVASPEYPKKYPNGADCIYRIKVPAGNIVELTFYEFKTEAILDYLDIYDGDAVDDSKLLGQVTGDMSPPDQRFRSSVGNNVLTLQFFSDLTNNDNGFYARYDAIPENVNNDPTDTACPPSQYKDTYGVIVSPHWPNLYPNVADCAYHVEVPAGNLVQLTVNFFDTEECCDILEVYNGDSAEDGQKIQDLSGTVDEGTTLKSDSNEMFLRFTTDFTNQRQGYSIAYKAIPADSQQRQSKNRG